MSHNLPFMPNKMYHIRLSSPIRYIIRECILYCEGWSQMYGPIEIVKEDEDGKPYLKEKDRVYIFQSLLKSDVAPGILIGIRGIVIEHKDMKKISSAKEIHGFEILKTGEEIATGKSSLCEINYDTLRSNSDWIRRELLKNISVWKIPTGTFNRINDGFDGIPL